MELNKYVVYKMGVTGLWKLIEQSGKPVPLETLENKVLKILQEKFDAMMSADDSDDEL